MNKLIKITAATLLAGTATLAAAQNSAKSFADEFATLQSYSGSSASAFYHPAPKTFNSTSQDPPTALTESQMQALSNESPMYQADRGNVHPSNGPTFAKENPHGLPYSYYEAASSNSDEWKLPASAGAPAYATVNGATSVASGTAAAPSSTLASK